MENSTEIARRPLPLPGLAARPITLATLPLALVWFLAYWLGGTGIDRSLLFAVYAADRPWVDLVILITHLGDWEVLMSISFFAMGWLILRRQWRTGLFLVAAISLGRLLISLQKVALGRLRPAETDHLVDVTTLSFPSGHSGNSMITYLLIAVLVAPPGRSRTIAVGCALTLSMLVGVSRSMLGVHWPSDVLGGWSFGLLWVMLCAALDRQWLKTVQ